MSKQLNNTASCGAPIQGHGNRTFTDYRPQQDFNNFTQHNVGNNNQYRLMLQRNGQAIINQQRNQVYQVNSCKDCDKCGQCAVQKK